MQFKCSLLKKLADYNLPAFNFLLKTFRLLVVNLVRPTLVKTNGFSN